MRVLLVDDEERFVSVLAKRLRLRGFQADFVCKGEDALRAAEEGRYDLALLDIKMPGMGGLELRRRLAGIAPGMRFVFVTGHGSQGDYETGRAEGCPYIAKPFEIEELIETIGGLGAASDSGKGGEG